MKTPVARAEELSLRVSKAFIEDEGKGLARVGADQLEALRAVPGDCLLITGRRSTVARAGHLTQHYEGKELLQIDSVTRDNAQISVDEICTVKKVPCKLADSVILSPVDARSQVPKEQEIPHILQLLSGLHVVIGDRVQIVLFGTRPQFFMVEGEPAGALRITASTAITFRSADFADEKAVRTSYEDIGGLDKELSHIREMIELPLKFPGLFTELGIDPPKGVLLSGPPGTGKTLIARAISSEVRAHFIHVNGPELIHKFYGESEAKLRQVFDEARKNAPSIIFFDEMDALAPKRANVVGDVEKRVVAQLLALMDGLVSRGEVVIIGATNMPELVDPALRRPGRFDREITIGVPKRADRLQILKIHSRKMPLAADVDLVHLAEITHGYVGADIAALCTEAGMATLRRILPSVKFEVDAKPTLENGLKINGHRRRFRDRLQGGRAHLDPGVHERAPEHLLQGCRWVAQDQGEPSFLDAASLQGFPIFANSRLSPPRGVLFSGPSGTGKTLMAKALAGEMGMTLFIVDPPTLLSKWVGESEKGLRGGFQAGEAGLSLHPVLRRDRSHGAGADRGRFRPGLPADRQPAVPGARRAAELAGDRGRRRDEPDRPDGADVASGGTLRFHHRIPPPRKGGEGRDPELYLLSLPFRSEVDIELLAGMSEGSTGAELEALCKKAVVLVLEEGLAKGGSSIIRSSRSRRSISSRRSKRTGPLRRSGPAK